MQEKPATQSKTVIVGVLALVVGILNEVSPLVQQYADQEVTRTAAIGGIVMIILRAVTNSPLVFPKKKK